MVTRSSQTDVKSLSPVADPSHPPALTPPPRRTATFQITQPSAVLSSPSAPPPFLFSPIGGGPCRKGRGRVGVTVNGDGETRPPPFCQARLRRRAAYQRPTAAISHQIAFTPPPSPSLLPLSLPLPPSARQLFTCLSPTPTPPPQLPFHLPFFLCN